MWTQGLMWLVTVLVIYISQFWVRKWRNPKCNGILPPGSMGFPLIGETLSLIIPSYSLDLHPFIKKRIQRYGPIFRTNIAGRPVVITTDPQFNNFLFQQEGKLIEQWYLDAFSKIFVLEGENPTSALGAVHKYIRSLFLDFYGAESIKERLLPQLEQFFNKTLTFWSTHPSVEVKHASSLMAFDISSKQILSYDDEQKSTGESLGEKYTRIRRGLMSFPLNIPGTSYHRCLKDKEQIVTILKDIVKERKMSSESNRGDVLDKMIKDMEIEKFLSVDFIVELIFGSFFAIVDGLSTALTLAFNLLSEHPSALEEMRVEHEAILKNRENPNSSLTWDEYRSMTFTLHVINETLRLGGVSPGLLRRALTDIPVQGYTIPAGWTIMMVTSALQLNPNTFQNPIEFNPWRWKELDSHVVSKNFMPFGGGMRQCAGSEYSRVFMASFFHVLLTKYSWTKTKGGSDIARNPVLGFGKGVHVNFSKK